MPRRKSPPKRITPPDNKYNSLYVSMIINRMMIGGKKSIAQAIMYRAMDIMEEKTRRNPVEVLDQALRNVAPTIEVKPMRVGGATYQVPVETSPERQLSLALRWIVDLANNRKGVAFERALAQEIRDAAAGQGNAVKKRDETHRMAQANRAFAHLRW